MKDLISREALKEDLRRETKILRGAEEWKAVVATKGAIAIVNEQPAVDAVEVVHGRWEMTADGAAKCTACGRKMNPSQYGYPHCSLCGARMDGE